MGCRECGIETETVLRIHAGTQRLVCVACYEAHQLGLRGLEAVELGRGLRQATGEHPPPDWPGWEDRRAATLEFLGDLE